ncbi:MAG: MaoC family dehydratase N-terminal domain-containing protein [Deltaproteobacteria bacterium]|nr:MaoC family dehydratase N-terminal domain-containing protein [Deltaproteobacteria bacterium]
MAQQGTTGQRDYFAEARSFIGHRDEQRLGCVTEVALQRYAVAVGDLNPLYFDDQAARAAGYPGIIAPPNFLSAVLGWQAGPPEGELRPDGTTAADVAFIALPGARLMGGGQELEIVRPVRPGDEVTLERRLADVEKREGKSGTLTLLKIEKRYRNQHDELLLICRETLIAR